MRNCCNTNMQKYGGVTCDGISYVQQFISVDVQFDHFRNIKHKSSFPRIFICLPVISLWYAFMLLFYRAIAYANEKTNGTVVKLMAGWYLKTQNKTECTFMCCLHNGYTR